jgi:oxygen-independent coproporphyrinogen III oxidase
VERFRNAGIDRINLDLIFGIPGQSLDEWRRDLDVALALNPSHLSCYGLMYEPNTALTMRLRAGQITAVDDETEAAMYEATIDTLADAGFEHYEISAWARPEERCRHNLLYWTNANWWPFGPSASGHWNGTRWKNIPRIADYLDCKPWPPITDVERVDDETRIGEELMLGLRLIDGIDRSRLDDLLTQTIRGKERATAIYRFIERNLLEMREGRLRLTRNGLLLTDEVLADLV